MRDQLNHILERYLAATGYTTCLWRTVRSSHVVYDPTGWFAALQEYARRPYPDQLREAIVQLNHPLLRSARGALRSVPAWCKSRTRPRPTSRASQGGKRTSSHGGCSLLRKVALRPA